MEVQKTGGRMKGECPVSVLKTKAGDTTEEEKMGLGALTK